MALPYICERCGSPWPADKTSCWSCGDTHRIDNPAYGRDQPAQRPYVSPAQIEHDYYPKISQTPYVVVTIAMAVMIGLLVWASLRGQVDAAFLYGLIAALFTAANVWLCCLVYITKARVDRIGTVLDDMARTVRSGNR